MPARILRLLTLIGILAICAMPAFANHIDYAMVTADCTRFMISVSRGDLNTPGATYVVNYKIVLTPTSGSAITITDSIPSEHRLHHVLTRDSDLSRSLHGSYRRFRLE